MRKGIKIGVDQDAQRLFYQGYSDKMQVLTKAIKIFTDEAKEPPKDMQLFEKGFFDYAMDYVSTKNPGGLSLGLSFDKYQALYGYDFLKLKDLDIQYRAIHGAVKFADGSFDVDFNGFNFNIYAESETEKQKLKDVTDLLKAMEVMHSKYIQGRELQNVDYLGSFFQVENGILSPSWRFIKN
jgi:hypothetical protein